MLCDNCKKREATVIIKELHNGHSHTLNLCTECAKLKEQEGGLGAFGINLGELIFNLDKVKQKLQQAAAGEPEPAEPAEPAETPDAGPDVVCPVCGWTREKLSEAKGKLGCPECYRVFGRIVDQALEVIQRGQVHIGKRPAARPETRETREFELAKLQRELQRLIRREEYEAAAVCRDRINRLRAELDADPGSEKHE